MYTYTLRLPTLLISHLCVLGSLHVQTRSRQAGRQAGFSPERSSPLAQTVCVCWVGEDWMQATILSPSLARRLCSHLDTDTHTHTHTHTFTHTHTLTLT